MPGRNLCSSANVYHISRQEPVRPRFSVLEAKRMAQNVYLLVWLALLGTGIMVRTGSAQTLPDLRIPFNVNDNFLLARADAGDDFFLTSQPVRTAPLRPDGCHFEPATATPQGLEPAATDRRSELGKKCFGVNPRTKPALRFTLAPVNPCTGSLRIDFASACAAQPAFGLTLWNSWFRMMDANAILIKQQPRERFHMRAALLQSLGFLMLEHGVRFVSDPYLRYLMFHKPFWHDYLASADNFQMNRWGDGDDFLVNYIGHPLEGSVSGNIFIQNDPQGRSARFGKSSAYWKSRMKAMAWAAAYSAYFEIGPVLSEAAIGNEGGYTYIPRCGFYPTCPKEPGESYKPPTNNTGWVDFVVTPVIGTGWLILEDFLEADLVDKLANGSPDLKFKILRGALAPSRTMSNFLAGRWPWYRPTNAREVAAAFGSPVRAAVTPAWKNDPRWSFGVQLATLNLPMDWEGCVGCRVTATGIGLDLDYRLTRLVYMDSEFNFFPGTADHGAMEEGLLGVKVGHTARSWGVFTQLRPGFVHYEKALVPGGSSDYEDATRFAFDVGGSVEYYPSRHSTIRFNMGTTFIHYLTGRPDPRQPPVSVLSDDFYATQGNFRATTGYVFRF